jgi:NADPH-dependent 2,4-dienoyl-CoA reductase/sulfur reductase-like enzyme/nitrite reductase/ring-hydroxylating ferredoxin subunit
MKRFLAKKNELKKGTMKNFSVGDTEVLLVRTEEGSFYATGPECTHYGAPLQKGILKGERIVCPWHHACFNCTTGEVLEPPALDDLNRYELSIENDEIMIEFPEEKKTKPEKINADEIKSHPTFVIIGSGAAGTIAARTLREEGFKGRVVVITGEKTPGYDRPLLSKKFLSGNIGSEELQLQKENFFDEYSIELMLDTSVVSLDAITKSITLVNGKNIVYDKLLISSGSRPVIPFIPGTELKNIFTLRNYRDSEHIIEESKKAKDCVILGSSFIGMETASSLLERNEKLNITVVTSDEVPYKNVFGIEVGEMIKGAHKNKGVKFISNAEATSFKGKNQVESVELSNGKSLNADMVIIGIGVKPATDFVKGINILEDGSIEVDKHFRVTDDIYAAGDIATFPDWRDNREIRIEHWRTALQQGKIAALNMLGRNVKYESVPFFWTNQAGLKLQYVGYTADWDNIRIEGDIKKQDFIAYYLKNKKVKAAAGSNNNKELAAIEELIRLDKMPSEENLPGSSDELMSLLNSS